MTLQVAQLFQSRRSVFWATSYSFGLELFDQFLLRRLGEPPLNAVILLDQGKAAELWDRIGEEASWRAARVNRDYLVRGIRAPGGGAFHPKTYLFADSDGGTLLVGSGNLMLGGIERGREVFVSFESSDPEGLAAIRGWQRWVAGLVEQTGDEQLARRLTAMRMVCPWLTGGEEESSQFITNAELPLVDELCAGIESPLDELVLSAPFFDAKLGAIMELIERTRPRRLALSICADANVDGNLLAERISGLAETDVRLFRFDPDQFVHAKLIGLISGDHGRLLSGSANLSVPALIGTADTPGANVEACVLASLPAGDIRAAFEPPDTTLAAIDVAQLRSLSFKRDPDPVPHALSLFAATLLPDGRVQVAVRGAEGRFHLFLAWDSGSLELEADSTAAPLSVDEVPVLVWITDGDGERLSNRVPLDEPAGLERALQRRERGADRPSELDPADAESPAGRVLVFLHDTFVFDIEDTPAVSEARKGEERSSDDADPEFWDRLAKETLQIDPRASTYRSIVERSALPSEGIFSLLSIMLDRTPARPRIYAVLGLTSENEEDEREAGRKWSTQARLRVRTTNVLRRWANSLSDPRLRWLGAQTPVANYVALLIGTTLLWEHEVLDEQRAITVLEDLFGSFMRRERASGFLSSLGSEDREQALDLLPAEAAALASALAYVVLRAHGPWHANVFTWQPFIVMGIEDGVIAAGPGAVEVVERLTGERPTADEIDERLLWAAAYINDERWAARIGSELGFEQVLIAQRGFNAAYPVHLTVVGSNDPLRDPHMLSAARQALRYRRSEGITIEAGATRMSLKLGGPAAAKVDGHTLKSAGPVTMDDLRGMETAGGGWAHLLVGEERAPA